MIEVTPVAFRNRNGHALFGILHLPESDRRRSVAILLLSPGVKMRVAPHRLYNKLAVRMAALGFPVFRYDFYGLGDSEGEIEERVLVQVYNSIQSGRFVDDTIDAMEYLRREWGLTRFIASGLCGGAISGLLAGERDERIEALLALGIPASFEGTEEHYDEYLTRGQLESLSHGYVRKLLQPKALLRFFTFRSSYRVIWRSFRSRWAARRAADTVAPPTDPKALGNYNPRFGRAFFAMLETSRPMLLIFSGADRWRWEFEEKFEQPNQARLAPYRELYETHTIPDANHILSTDEWLGAAWNHARAWLSARYPA
jgi:pimeloyl-ACP methyl ester carboxylesterase